MSLDVNKYAGQIWAILETPGVDLSTISAKRVRKQLLGQNDELTSDLIKEYKEELDALIGSIYEQVSGEGGEEDEDGSGKRKYEDGEDEVNAAPSAKKTKKNSAKTDAELARQLSKELNGRERNARAAAPKAKAGGKRGKKGAKSSAIVDSDGEGSVDPEAKPKRKGGFTKEYLLSEPLADLLGVTQLSRPQAVKHIWIYIKAKDLQNPSDKREIICDEKMKRIFRVDKIGMFKMNQMLGAHLTEPAPNQPTPEDS